MGKPSGGDGVLTPMKCLMGNSGNVQFSPISLFLLGKASPYLHNGVQYQEDDEGGVSKGNKEISSHHSIRRLNDPFPSFTTLPVLADGSLPNDNRESKRLAC